MTANRETFVAAMMPMYREIFATAQEEITAPNHPHRAHLRYALHLLETATPAWWDAAIERKDPMGLALDQTAATAQCDHSPTIEAVRVMGWGGFR